MATGECSCGPLGDATERVRTGDSFSLNRTTYLRQVQIGNLSVFLNEPFGFSTPGRERAFRQLES